MRYRLRGGAFDGNEVQVIRFMDEDQQDVNKCESWNSDFVFCTSRHPDNYSNWYGRAKLTLISLSVTVRDSAK